MMKIVIATLPEDIHAQSIAWALHQKGHDVETIFPLDLADGAVWTVEFEPARLVIAHRSGEKVVTLRDVDSYWARRVPAIYPLAHIDDVRERAAAETEMSTHAMAALRAIELHAFTVNLNEANSGASYKPTQLHVAQRVGLATPRTVVTNSLERIREFYVAMSGAVVYKALRPFFWARPTNGGTTAPTTYLESLEALEDMDIQASPSIFQEAISRVADVRVTIMGQSVFAWEARPHETVREDTSKIDWRCLRRSEVKYQIHQLPESLAGQCVQLTKVLGLVSGCLDFALTADGRYVFLEINPSGQFLWGDELDIGLNQLDAFVQFLESRDADFIYRPTSNRLSLHAFLSEAEPELIAAEEASNHSYSMLKYQLGRVSVNFLSE